MRFIASSELLGDVLSLKYGESMLRISVNKNVLTFHTNERDTNYYLTVDYPETRITQDRVNWKQLASILRRIDDQPVILDIEENKAQLIFEF